MARRILVATDGTPAALGAMRLAREMETKQGRRVEAIGVIEPVPVFDAGFMVALPEGEIAEPRQEALRAEIRKQVALVAGTADAWPISVENGIPGTRIVKRAEELKAHTILLGLGRHRPVDRVFGTETALQVLRVSHIPVLAVPESFDRLPRTAAVGVDFSEFSRRAGQAAASVLDPPWELNLVHVMSGIEFLPHVSEQWRDEYEEELVGRLKESMEDLTVPEGSTILAHVLEGEPARKMLEFAEAKRIELLVAGSHGHSFVGRLLMGSVSTRLIRGSRVPVLVVPPVEVTDEVLVGTPPHPKEHPWVRILHEFTQANAGRRTTLHIDDPELGEKECGLNFPLWGVSFDPKRNRLQIMLGRSGTVEGHLTHSLTHPQEIEVIAGPDGRSEALRIGLLGCTATLRLHHD